MGDGVIVPKHPSLVWKNPVVKRGLTYDAEKYKLDKYKEFIYNTYTNKLVWDDFEEKSESKEHWNKKILFYDKKDHIKGVIFMSIAKNDINIKFKYDKTNFSQMDTFLIAWSIEMTKKLGKKNITILEISE